MRYIFAIFVTIILGLPYALDAFAGQIIELQGSKFEVIVKPNGETMLKPVPKESNKPVEFKKKTLVDCTKFIQRDMDVTGLGFMIGQTPFENDIPIILDSTHVEFNPIGKNATCGSGDNFVEDRTNYYGEVVDMEAYALAKVCHLHNIPFISFKYITDGADEQANEDWEANLASGIVEFKKKVLDLLPNI